MLRAYLRNPLQDADFDPFVANYSLVDGALLERGLGCPVLESGVLVPLGAAESLRDCPMPFLHVPPVLVILQEVGLTSRVAKVRLIMLLAE